MESKKDRPLVSFSDRLTSSLKRKGMISRAAKSGVKVAELASVIGCTQPAARNYVEGKRIPNHAHLVKMADWLEVDPAWLLFGKSIRTDSFGERELVNIDYDLLEKIISASSTLFKKEKDPQEVVRFIMELIYDVSHLKADRETLLKTVDMALSWAKFTNHDKKNESPSTKEECANA